MSEYPDGILNPSQEATDPEHLDPPADSPVVLAHVIAEAVRDIAETLHIHRYDILGVYEPPPVRPVLHPLVPVPVQTTVALLRCRECGLRKRQRSLGNGPWSRSRAPQR